MAFPLQPKPKKGAYGERIETFHNTAFCPSGRQQGTQRTEQPEPVARLHRFKASRPRQVPYNPEPKSQE